MTYLYKMSTAEMDHTRNEKCEALKTGYQSKVCILVQMRVIQRNAEESL